ncbi:MAG: hypothetical protein DHS20C16_24540 [Phycisphaerae bacterium]|nr:MAG: hypothetical protein DHS20C16_24540 [Phycisphaerae bacterium]
MRVDRRYLSFYWVIALIPFTSCACLFPKQVDSDPQDSNNGIAQSGNGDSQDWSADSVVDRSAGSAGQHVGSIHMQFDVHRVELPIEEERRSLDLWKHLNESLGDPQLTALLARNGLRAGKGDRDAWPAMKSIIEDAGGRMGTYRHVLDNGLSLLVNLDRTEGGESYFLHERGGSLKGGSLPEGTKRILIDYAAQDGDATRVILKVRPELEEARTRSRWVEQDGNVANVQDHDGITFDELAVMIKLAPGEFAVLGSSEQADSGYLIGSRWLSSTLGMKNHETVLFIRPQLVRVN